MPLPDTDAPPIRDGAAPQLDPTATGAKLDALSCIQPAYMVLTTAIVGWLRYHFGAESRIEYEPLKSRVYTPLNMESSPIQIMSLAEWKPTTAGQRPCILVDRLDQDKDMLNRPIGEQFQGVRMGYFGNFWIGQHVVHCVGGREGEAELLAAEVLRDLERFAPVVRERLNLLRLTTLKVGKRRQIEEYKEHFSVPVPVVYGYQNAWTVRPLDEQEIAAIRVQFNI